MPTRSDSPAGKGDASASAADGPRIRPAVPADAPVLARMRYRMRAEIGTPTEAEDGFVERCAAWMAERLAPGSAWRCWVAEEGGRIVGHAWVQVFEKMPNPVDELERHGYVTNMYVAPELRGRGLGGALLDLALRHCREQEVDEIILWPSERSRSLYLRAGFTVHGDLLELRSPRRKSNARADD